MASQLNVNPMCRSNVVFPSKARHPWRFVNYSPSKNISKVCRCLSSPFLPRAVAITTSTRGDGSQLGVGLCKPQAICQELGVTGMIEMLKERTRSGLKTSSDPTVTMKLIDTIQRLGIGYHFEEDINGTLENLEQRLPEDDLYTVALRFRLCRHNGIHANPDVFETFMDANGEFKESLSEDIEGLLSLYEASYLGANGEAVLSQAKEFTTSRLKSIVSRLTPDRRKNILQGLELPRHLRMARLEARRYIEEYSNDDNHNSTLLKLAKLDYNQVQSLLQAELVEVTRWWRHLGLESTLSFVRDRHLECFLWSVGLSPEPKDSSSRIVIAKTVAILLVLDDIFDTYGSYDDLVLFTKAIRRWDLNQIKQLPEYMKICYMALYNTTNEICYEILQEHGFNVDPYLRKTWIDMVEAYMVEVEWVKGGTTPNLEDYIQNGVTTSGTYMALVHLFFLVVEGISEEKAKDLLDPYPKFFSVAGTILRLWDDLGTFKEEQERADVASSIQLLMREKNITSEDEGRRQILQRIHSLWDDLNGALVAPDVLLMPIIRVALNLSRASQAVYQHNDDSYLSSVENHVQSLFFTPIDI